MFGNCLRRWAKSVCDSSGDSTQVSRPGLLRIFGDSRLTTDGEILAVFLGEDAAWSVEEHGIVREWSLTTGRQRRQRYLGEVEPLWAFRPDGKVLASAGRELAIFDVTTGQELSRARPTEWVTALCWSADGKWLATGHDNGQICMWDGERLRTVRQMRLAGQAVSAVAFSGDSEWLAVADEACRLAVFSRFAGELLTQWHCRSGRIAALAWHPHLSWLVSAGWDTHAHLWQLSEREPVALFNAHDECVTALALSPDGSILATGDSAGYLRLWGLDSRRLVHEVIACQGELHLLAFDQTGQRLLSGGEERRLGVWDVASGKIVLGCGSASVGRIRLAWADASGWLALATGRSVQVLDTRQGRPIWQLEHAHGATSVLWANDAQLLITGDGVGSVHRWSGSDGQWLGCWQEHRTAVIDLDWDSQGQVLASAGGADGYVYLWTLGSEDPHLLIPEAAAGGTSEAVRFVPQMDALLVGGVDWPAESRGAGALVCWNLIDKSARVLMPQGVLRLAVRRDGRRAVVANLHGTVWLVELPSGRILAELAGHSEPVLALAFHPRTGEILTASEDHLLCAWSEAGRLLCTNDLEVSVHDAVFADSGEYIFTANGNQTAFQLESVALGFGQGS